MCLRSVTLCLILHNGVSVQFFLCCQYNIGTLLSFVLVRAPLGMLPVHNYSMPVVCRNVCNCFMSAVVRIQRYTHCVDIQRYTHCVDIQRYTHCVDMQRYTHCVDIQRYTHCVDMQRYTHCVDMQRYTHCVDMQRYTHCVDMQRCT